MNTGVHQKGGSDVRVEIGAEENYPDYVVIPASAASEEHLVVAIPAALLEALEDARAAEMQALDAIRAHLKVTGQPPLLGA